MSTTPDRAPGPSVEERTDYEQQAGASTISEGQQLYSDGQFKMRDASGEFDPRGGGALPAASVAGQVLYSTDGVSFTVQLPLTSCNGWLVNDDGEHLVVG